MADARSERDLVRALQKAFGGAGARRVASVGIGDDAAVLRAVKEPLVWTIDTSVEDVHFRRSWLSLREIGARSFHAAASDLAAMGARPIAALSNVTVPAGDGAAAVLAIARGQVRAARALGCPVVGGNVSRGGELSVTTTVLGRARTPVQRSGARPGDQLWLLGDVGLAGAGRAWLSRAERTRFAAEVRGGRGSRAARACVAAFRSPVARLRDGLALVGRARAALDVSDGLALDAARLAEASHVRLVVELAALVRCLRPELVEVAGALGLDPIELALSGGEDYALLATGPARRKPRGARCLGRVERGSGAWLERASGLTSLHAGFDHFRQPRPRKSR